MICLPSPALLALFRQRTVQGVPEQAPEEARAARHPR